jgi:hypothetical protein
MTIGKRPGIALVAFAVAALWALPAPAAEVPVSPTPAAEAPAAPAAKVKTAAPVHKVKKTRVVKKFWRHRPIRVVSVDWPLISGCRGCSSYIFIGIGF